MPAAFSHLVLPRIFPCTDNTLLAVGAGVRYGPRKTRQGFVQIFKIILEVTPFAELASLIGALLPALPFAPLAVSLPRNKLQTTLEL